MSEAALLHSRSSRSWSGFELDSCKLDMNCAAGKRARTSTGGTASLCQSEPAWPAGPAAAGAASLCELMSWAQRYICELEAAGLLEHLLRNLSQGVNTYSDYSGMGCFEQALVNIREALQWRHHSVGIGFRSIRACDIGRLQQRVLLSHEPGPEAPLHIFTDILNRVPVPVVQALHRIRRWYARDRAKLVIAGEWTADLQESKGQAMVDSMLDWLRPHPISDEDQGHCVAHGQRCAFQGHVRERLGNIDLWAAGSTCVNHSTMGSREGVFGESIIALMCWLWAVACCLPDLAVHECTPLIPKWLFVKFWGNFYRLLFRVWCPTQAGVPARRKRMYLIAVKKSTMIEVVPDSTYVTNMFEKIFFRPCSSSGRVFLWDDEGFQMDGLPALARKRGLPGDLHWSLSQVIPPGQGARLEAFQRLAARSGKPGPWFAHLGQSPHARRAMTNFSLPALLRGTELMCLDPDNTRYLEPKELMSSLLLPVHSWCGEDGPWTAGPQHRLAFASLLSALTRNQVRTLAGNGMNLIQIGACVLSCLSTFRKMPTEAPQPQLSLHKVSAEESDDEFL